MVDWRAVAASMMHSTQIKIVERLDGVERSPKQLSDELGIPLDNVSHHVRALAKAGVLVLVNEQRKRGGMQHFYALATGDERSVRRAA
jgi:DNA-binding transcriptional ArsR family regulator